MDLTASLSLPSKGIAPIPIDLEKVGRGHFVASGTDVPIAGTWTLTVHALLTDIDEATLTTPVHIR
jgi:copper transport protein